MDAGGRLLYLPAITPAASPYGHGAGTGTHRPGSIMGKPLSVCVFCGSGFGRDPAWAEAAGDTGTILARHGVEVVYGGGHVGLMGLVADAALAQGGRVVGIIPRHLARAEVEHGHLSELIETETMSQRKTAMIARSDAFVVLPGGIGTLDERLEVITLRQPGQHEKPTIMVDTKGYWRDFARLLDAIVAQDFARENVLEFMTWVDSPADLPAALGLAD